MSTKIYNGLLIDFPGTIAELRLELIQLAKHKLIPAAETESAKLLANISIDHLDKDLWLAVDSSNTTSTMKDEIFKAWDAVQSRVHAIKTTDRRDPAVDFEFSLTLFPIKDKVLAIPICENRNLLSILTNQPYVKEYGYWDNTDQPEGISDEDWAVRSQDWDKAVGDSGILSENGFKIHLIREGYVAGIDYVEIQENLPSMAYRVDSIVKLEVEKLIDIELGNEALSISTVMQIIRDWKESPEGLEKTEALRVEITSFLTIQDAIELQQQSRPLKIN